jgi:hypothetical protein
LKVAKGWTLWQNKAGEFIEVRGSFYSEELLVSFGISKGAAGRAGYNKKSPLNQRLTFLK